MIMHGLANYECILLRALGGWQTDCKNMQGTNYIKFVSVVLDTSILRLYAVVTDKQLPTSRSQAVQDGLDVPKNLPVYAV
jgi:hypothetical protein